MNSGLDLGGHLDTMSGKAHISVEYSFIIMGPLPRGYKKRKGIKFMGWNISRGERKHKRKKGLINHRLGKVI